MNRDIRLLCALCRHRGTNLVHEPLLELLLRFERAAADDQGIGIKGIDHFIKKQSKRMSLHPEDLFAHRVALFRQSSDKLGSLMKVADFVQFMIGILRQKIGKQRPFNGGQ